MAESTGEEKPEDKDMVRVFVNFNQEVMLWGSSDLIKSWAEFQKYFRTLGPSGEAGAQVLLVFENLIRQIRKDLGHSNKGLRQGDLLRAFITDLDDHLAAN